MAYGPINIFFLEKEDGSLEVSFNGGRIFPSKLNATKRALDALIASLTPEDVETYNKEVDAYWESQFTNTSKQERVYVPQPGFIYLIKSQDKYKLGRAKDMKNRFKAYTTENPHGAELLGSKEFLDYVSAEAELLKKYSKYKFRGEWFILPDGVVKEIIDFLK